jgi:flagellar protein FlaI
LELIEVGLPSIKNTASLMQYIQQQFDKVVKDLGISLTESQYSKLFYYIYRNFVGYNEIEAFLQDPNIEDISCDGINTPLYVIHRHFGSLKTNVIFEDLEKLREFVVKLAERCGRYVSYAEPILDGTLPDGSRVSATLAGDVATRGPTFTIRKFGEKPFSPIEQIHMGTADAAILAYFWYLIEHGASMLIVGGVSTGKTSFLNSIAMFIPPEAKIISIEDTREIRIPHQHWIAGLARTGFGIPLATGAKYGEVSLFDLLRESFRQNPDYVIVGEVRGEETYVMFQGMSSGHPSISTFHAGSVETVIKRLTTPPIQLSPTLIESLDVIVVMTHAREKGKSARRIKEVVEILSVDPKTSEVKTNVIFRWNPATDKFERLNPSVKLEKYATARGSTLEAALQEVERRQKILEWLMQKNVTDYKEFTSYVNTYYKEPEKILSLLQAELKVAVPQKRIEEKPAVVAKPEAAALVKAETKPKAEVPKEEVPKRKSLLELLGYKFLEEK